MASNEIVIKIKKRNVPTCFANSDDHRSLNEDQKQSVVSRLIYIEEIPAKINEWLATMPEKDELKSFIDRVELDLMINIGVQHSSQISPWLFHSSWTFDTSAQAMLKTLPSKFINEIQQILPGFNATLSEFGNWLSNTNTCLQLLLDGFYESTTFDAAMGHLIAIDIVLSRLLAGISTQRLNPNL